MGDGEKGRREGKGAFAHRRSMIRGGAGVIEKNLFPVVGGASAADLLPTNENTAGRIAALRKVYTNLNARMKSSSLFSSSAFFSTPRSGGNRSGLDQIGRQLDPGSFQSNRWAMIKFNVAPAVGFSFLSFFLSSTV